MKTIPSLNDQKGNAVIIVLVVLIIIAVGALAYLSGQMAADGGGNDVAADNEMVATDGPDNAAQQNTPQNELNIEPGNPVIAEVNGEEITRMEVFQFIQNLPEETRQLPFQQLFPLALTQVINARIISDKVEDVELKDDPEVERRLEAARKQIVRSVYLQNQVEDRITEERLKDAYEQYKGNFPEVQEARAAHILVEDKDTAEEVMQKLEEGADFAELARDYSIDATAEQGGQLNYFTQQDVVPEFGEAVFNAEVGEVIDEPVKSQFGHHIIKVQERRIRPVPPFEQAKPFLEAQLRRALLDEMLADWRGQADVERYDINGNPVNGVAKAPETDDKAEDDAQEPAEDSDPAPAE